MEDKPPGLRLSLVSTVSKLELAGLLHIVVASRPMPSQLISRSKPTLANTTGIGGILSQIVVPPLMAAQSADA